MVPIFTYLFNFICFTLFGFNKLSLFIKCIALQLLNRVKSFKQYFILLNELISLLYLIIGVNIIQMTGFNFEYKTVYLLFNVSLFLLLKYSFNFFYVKSFSVFRIYFYVLSLNLIFSFSHLLVITKRKCSYSLSFYRCVRFDNK